MSTVASAAWLSFRLRARARANGLYSHTEQTQSLALWTCPRTQRHSAVTSHPSPETMHHDANLRRTPKASACIFPQSWRLNCSTHMNIMYVHVSRAGWDWCGHVSSAVAGHWRPLSATVVTRPKCTGRDVVDVLIGLEERRSHGILCWRFERTMERTK